MLGTMMKVVASGMLLVASVLGVAAVAPDPVAVVGQYEAPSPLEVVLRTQPPVESALHPANTAQDAIRLEKLERKMIEQTAQARRIVEKLEGLDDDLKGEEQRGAAERSESPTQ